MSYGEPTEHQHRHQRRKLIHTFTLGCAHRSHSGHRTPVLFLGWRYLANPRFQTICHFSQKPVAETCRPGWEFGKPIPRKLRECHFIAQPVVCATSDAALPWRAGKGTWAVLLCGCLRRLIAICSIPRMPTSCTRAAWEPERVVKLRVCTAGARSVEQSGTRSVEAGVDDAQAAHPREVPIG
jgi:hypothetical protein